MNVREYRPSSVEERSLVCLAEAWHLLRRLPDLWPGWDMQHTPVALYGRDGGVILAGHPVPPRRARPVLWPVLTAVGAQRLPDADAGCALPRPVYLRRLPAAVTGGAAVVNYLGRPTAFVPIEWAGETAEGAVDYVARLAGEACRAYLHRAGRREDAAAAPAYPDDHPVNNALGNIEGQLLLEAYHCQDEARLPRLALAVALIRRERRAQLPDELILYEQTREYFDGLAVYVRFRVLETLAQPGYQPTRPFRDVFGADLLSAGDQRARLLASLESINRRGSGAARRRFSLSGMGLALLLDRFLPGWKEQLLAERVWLDSLLERRLSFDGGAGDDMVIAEAENRFGYLRKLEEERAHAQALRRRKQELVEQILRGDGTLFIFDISELRLTATRCDPDRVESINERLHIHRGPVRFEFGRTVLAFDGIPVVEDRHAGLLEVCLPAPRLKLLGDGGEMRLIKPAEFTHGFELQVGGVRVAARRGIIQPIEGALYIKLKR